jgi:hypothetical protein
MASRLLNARDQVLWLVPTELQSNAALEADHDLIFLVANRYERMVRPLDTMLSLPNG